MPIFILIIVYPENFKNKEFMGVCDKDILLLVTVYTLGQKLIFTSEFYTPVEIAQSFAINTFFLLQNLTNRPKKRGKQTS